MLNSKSVLWMLLSVGVLTGCQSFTGFDFDSDAIVGGGAVAGKDYITGLKPSLKAREYFVKSNANASQKKTVTPGDDQGTGVVWTDDGGIIIPPGCSIEFTNKGYCLDPHLPAPKAGEEMQFVKTSSLIPSELQGTYRNLLKRSAAGDEEVKSNMQRLVWALRTAGSDDAMATHLTDRQREILSECAENGSFEEYVYRHELYGKIVEELKNKLINKISDSTSVRVGDVVYNAFDLLDPDKAKEKVSAHLESLVRMNLHLPVTKSGFNFGELTNGIYTDIKGNASLSFKAKIANSTSQPYTFYPMDYAAQVGSGGSSVGFYAAANIGMRQRVTIDMPKEINVDVNETKKSKEEIDNLLNDIAKLEQELAEINNLLGGAPRWMVDASFAILNLFELAKEGVSMIKGGEYVAAGMDLVVEGLRNGDKEFSEEDLDLVLEHGVDIAVGGLMGAKSKIAKNKMLTRTKQINNELNAGVINAMQAKSAKRRAVQDALTAEAYEKIVDGAMKVKSSCQTMSDIDDNAEKQKRVSDIYDRKDQLEKELKNKKARLQLMQ